MTAGRQPPRSPTARQALLHLFVLSAFAIAQPLFDLLARYPAFFVAHGAGARDIVGFAIVLTLLPPAALALVELGVGLVSAAARRALHLGFVGALVGLCLLPPLHNALPLPPLPALALALAAAALAAWAYARLAVARTFVSVLSPAVALFPALFLFHSPVAPLLATTFGGALGATEIRRPAPVVMVVFDELSRLALLDGNGTIDAVRYPNFAALAGTATWYANATTVADHTVAAVPAILTGRQPADHRLPTAIDHPHNLFTLLGATYEIRASEELTELCPEDLCPRAAGGGAAASTVPELVADAGLILLHALAPIGWRSALPDVQRRWTFDGDWLWNAVIGASLRDPVASFKHFVTGIAPRSQPSLWFLHVMLPHSPYRYLRSGRSYEPPQAQFGTPLWAQPKDSALLAKLLTRPLDAEDFSSADREAARLNHLRYLHQVGFVDHLLGRLLHRLRNVGMFDETLLVVTADHGVCLRPGCSPRYANADNLEEITAVPLFIKVPGQRRGRVDERSVETIDIVPTIAELLDATLPWPVDGQSLVAADFVERPEKGVYTPRGREDMFALTRLAVPATRPATSAGRAHQLALFGAGTPLDGRAPNAALAMLLDRPVASLPTAAAPFAATLDHADRFADVRPRSGSLPAFVQGTVDAAGAAGTPLAISVNGIVRAVTEVLPDGSQTPAFGALIPEPAWRPGANRVEVHAVAVDGGVLRLARVGGNG